jgi:histidinol-phosphate aminotransferase
MASSEQWSLPEMLFIASPNNPDGSLLDVETMDELLALPLLVVLDEAYIEFAGEALGADLSRIREVPPRENLAVLRTFSKWASLAAGGWAFTNTPAAEINSPSNVNVAKCGTFHSNMSRADKSVQRLRAERHDCSTAIHTGTTITINFICRWWAAAKDSGAVGTGIRIFVLFNLDC